MAGLRGRLQHLKHANVGKHVRETDRPKPHLCAIPNTINTTSISRCRRVGAVAPSLSWLLDLTRFPFLNSRRSSAYSGRVSDSGEGRWTILAAIESTTPATGAHASLYPALHFPR
jgi:6-phosphogluconate dehydrogenase